MNTRDELANTPRLAATLAAIVALIATAVAPADNAALPTSPSTTQTSTTQTSTTQTSTMPATTFATTTTVPATSGPTTVTVVVQVPPTSKPAVTMADVDEARQRGDLLAHVAHALGEAGVRETIAKTQWYEWFYAMLAIVVGLFAGRLVAKLFGMIGERAAEQVNLTRAVVLHAFAGPVSLLVTMIGVAVGLSFLDFTPAASLVLLTGFQLVFNVLIGWLLYNLVEVVSLLLLRLSRGRQGNLSTMLVPVVRRVLRATIVVFLLLFTLNNTFDRPIPSLLAGVGIAGLAVSLAAQDMLKNFFGSVMIFADQPFLMGDLVRVDAFEGVVEDIGFRSTRIRTGDGFLISIPNARVADAAVTNLSRRKATRRVIDVGLSYDSTPSQVDAALSILRGIVADATIAADFDKRRGDPSVALDELRPGAMRIRVVYWLSAADVIAQTVHAERVNLTILRRFADAGIRFTVVA